MALGKRLRDSAVGGAVDAKRGRAVRIAQGAVVSGWAATGAGRPSAARTGRVEYPEVMVLYGPADEWPPPTTMAQADVAKLVMFRLRHENGLNAVNQTGATLTARGWTARVGIDPCDETTITAVRTALAPMEVETYRQEVARPFSEA